MTSFISASMKNGYIITINGSAKDAPKTQFDDGGSAVQLRKARTEESHFDWSVSIKKVIIINTIIYDKIDVACLQWFIENGIKVDLSKSYVSPDALKNLDKMCESLKERNIKVIKGSTIRLPTLGGLSGMGKSETASLECRNIGFKVSY